MLDHIGIGVSDFARAKAFYEKALAPLGVGVVMEVTAEQTGDHPAAGFGSQGKPYFWFGVGEIARTHIAFTGKDRASGDAFYKAAMAAGGKDNGAPASLTDLARFKLQGDPGGKAGFDLSTWVPFPSRSFASLGRE